LLASLAVLAALVAVNIVMTMRAVSRARSLSTEALVWETSGRSADALKSLNDAIASSDGNESPSLSRPGSRRYARGILLAARAQLELGRGLWDDAAKDARAAAKRGSKDAETVLARALLRSGRLFEAIEAYDAAIRAEPEVAALYVERGDLRLRLVRLQDAVEDETKALELGAAGDLRLKALLIRGRTRLAMNDYPGGVADLGAVLETDPGNSLARLLRGQTRFAQRDYDGALQDGTELSKLDPTNGPAYLLRAEANLAKGRKTEARKDLREAQKLMPGDPLVTRLFQQLRRPS
jgi:tetratricopeptide (TPR) repeat protein